MKLKLFFICTLVLHFIACELNGQGWVAEITININHGDYALETINSGSVKLAGQTVNITNQIAPVSLIITGSGQISGLLEVSVSATAQFPYPNSPNGLPPNFAINDSYSGNVSFDCSEYQYAGVNADYFNGKIKVTPRVILNPPSYTGACTNQSVSLIASSCSGYSWGISAVSGGPYQVIPSHTNSELAVTRQLVSSMGFATSVNNFYVTVIGLPQTRSVERSILLVAPPPQFSSIPVNPTCNNGKGSINIMITPSSPAITDFAVSLFQTVNGPSVAQLNITSTTHSFSNLDPGPYYVQVQNSTNIAVLGDCGTGRIQAGSVTAPPPITVTLAPYPVTCNGYNNGSISASFQNAVQPINYSWTGAGAGNNPRTSLAPGSYALSITDARGCTGSSGLSEITQPPPLTVDATVVPLSNGFHVTCNGYTDATINTSVSGGTGAKNYYWTPQGQTSSSLTNVGAGSYSVFVTDANNCQASHNVQVNAPPPITFSISEDSDIDCPGTGPGSATGSLSAGVISNTNGTVTYLWSNGQTSSSINNLTAGNYNLTVTNPFGCTGFASHQLNSPPAFSVQLAPASNYNGSRISCYGEADGSLEAQLLNSNSIAVGATNYQWYRNNLLYAGGANNLLTDLNAATYRVVATYGPNCTVENTIVLSQPTPVSALIAPTSNHNGFPISCPGASDGAIQATGTGGTPGGYIFDWVDGPSDATFSALAAGTYIVNVIDINGCEGSSSYDLIEPLEMIPAIEVTSNYHGQALSCANASDGILTASAQHGAAPIQFQWSNGAGGNVISNLAAGNYSVVATDANGCTVESEVTQIANPEPVIASISVLSDYNGQAIRCFNESNGILRAAGIGGTNVFAYSWSNSATSVEVNGLQHGMYSVTVRDQNNCEDSESIELVNPEQLVASVKSHSNFNGFGVQCHGSSNGFIEVEANGGTNVFTYNWPSLAETTPLVENLSSGTYNVIIIDSNGCTDGLAFEITEPDPLTISLASLTNVTCFGGHDGVLIGNADGGVLSHEFALNALDWNESPIFSDLVAEHEYKMFVRDGNQCVASFTQMLTQPEEIKTEFAVEPALCASPIGSVTAFTTGGVGVLSFQWEDINAKVVGLTSEITNQYSGIYKLRVEDESMCVVTESVGIPSLDGPVLEVSENTPASCFESSDGIARVFVIEGHGPYTITWEDGQTDWLVSNLAKGLHFASVTDINNCVSVVPIEMQAPERITLNDIETTNPSCYLACDGAIEIKPSGGNGNYSFFWNSSSGENLATNLCAGLMEIKVIDQLGCTEKTNVTLENPEQVDINVKHRKLPDCFDNCDGSIEVVASGGDGNYSYRWESGSSSSIQTGLCPGSYQLNVTDGKGCSLTEAIALGNTTKIEIDLIRQQTPVCFGDCNGVLEVAARGGAGNYHYEWTDKSTLAANLNLCAGEQQVIVRDNNDCEVTRNFHLPTPPELKVDLGGGVVLCEGQSYELNAGPNWKSVVWSQVGNLISTEDHITVTQPGPYAVEVADDSDCKAQDTFVLETSNDLLEAMFIIAAEAYVGDTVAVIDISWPLPESTTWSFPIQMEKITEMKDVVFGRFDEKGEYEISLNATLGKCHDQISKTIKILDITDEHEGGRLGGHEFVKQLTLHPNPNSGSFEVEIEFIEESQIAIFIWNQANSKLIAEVRDQGYSKYKKHFDLTPISAGTYILKVEYNGGSRAIRFLVQ